MGGEGGGRGEKDMMGEAKRGYDKETEFLIGENFAKN